MVFAFNHPRFAKVICVNIHNMIMPDGQIFHLDADRSYTVNFQDVSSFAPLFFSFFCARVGCRFEPLSIGSSQLRKYFQFCILLSPSWHLYCLYDYCAEHVYSYLPCLFMPVPDADLGTVSFVSFSAFKCGVGGHCKVFYGIGNFSQQADRF